MSKINKFRVVYLDDTKTVAEIFDGTHYSVIGNSDTFPVRQLKKDWGKNARWGRYIKLP